MAVHLADEELRALLETAAAEVDIDERARQANLLIEHLETSETIEAWARSLARTYGRPQEYQEFAQVIYEALIVYSREIDQQTLDSVDRVATHLYFKAKTAVVTWLDSSAVTVATRMSGFSRRYRQAMAARSEFMGTFGKEPTDQELVNYINGKALRTRADAAKQGALVTVDDVTGKALSPYSMEHTLGDGEYAADSFGAPSTDEDIQARGELSLTVRALGMLADQMYGTNQSPTTREVMAAWMELVLANEPPTMTAIAARFGMNRQQARERMNQVDAVLARLRDELAAD